MIFQISENKKTMSKEGISVDNVDPKPAIKRDAENAPD